MTATDVVVQSDRLLVLPGLLDAGHIVEVCCALLPRDLTAQERMQLDLPPDSPECMLAVSQMAGAARPIPCRRHQRGQCRRRGPHGNGRTGEARVTRHPGRYGRADIRQLVALGDFIWTHYAGAMGALCRRYNLTSNNEDFELAGEIFDALLEVAEEIEAAPFARGDDHRVSRPCSFGQLLQQVA